MFIKKLLQNWGKVNLFTRPRRFGKSLNMSMLKCFFEIGGDPSVFDGLNFKAAADALRTMIGNESKCFRFLLESPSLSEKDKTAYERLINVDSRSDASYAMSDATLIDSLNILSQLLAQHYAQKVILLIDEYDVPLDKAFQGGYYDEMVSLIRSLLGNALKTNYSLYFAVLTGCLRISKESIFTGLNNLKVHAISDFRYDGYRFGDTDVYCLWDVINYCDELLADPYAEPENYWANTSGNDLIRRLLKKANRG